MNNPCLPWVGKLLSRVIVSTREGTAHVMLKEKRRRERQLCHDDCRIRGGKRGAEMLFSRKSARETFKKSAQRKRTGNFHAIVTSGKSRSLTNEAVWIWMGIAKSRVLDPGCKTQNGGGSDTT